MHIRVRHLHVYELLPLSLPTPSPAIKSQALETVTLPLCLLSFFFLGFNLSIFFQDFVHERE